MKAADLKTKDINALNTELENLRKEQFNLRMQLSTGQLGQTHQVKQVRKDIARVKTVINQKKGSE